MSRLAEHWNAQQRARWMQPNRERWMRPGADRYLHPDAIRYWKPDAHDRRYWALPPEIFPSEVVGPPPPSKGAPAVPEKMRAAIEAERAHLRWLIADFKFQLELHRLRLKAGYNPDQPRVPAGNPDGGQWTSDGGGAGTNSEGSANPIRLAGPIPTNEPPEIPKEKPPTAPERNSFIKSAARWLGKYGGPLGKLAGAAYWLYEYEDLIQANLDPPKSLEELHDAVSNPKRGYEVHHIVEQTSAEQDGYPRQLIDGRDNLVRIPTLKHREITSWYQTKNDDFGGLSPREYLRGRGWEERRRIGLDALFDHGVLDR